MWAMKRSRKVEKMSYRTKKDVLGSIRTRKRVRNGEDYVVYDAYLGYDPFTKKQRRIQSVDLSDLKAQVERFYIEYRAGGDSAARLKPYEAADAREAIDILVAHGKKISLTDVVRRFLSGSMAETSASDVTLGEALEKFISAQVGKSEGYMKAIRYQVGKFVDCFGSQRKVCEVTAAAIDKDLRERLVDKNNPKTWKTFNNQLGIIGTFFNWCTKAGQGYIEKNPAFGVERIPIAWREPEYMKAGDVKKLFAAIIEGSASQREDLADAVLSFFCGMRTAEIARIREGASAVNVNVDEGFIRVIKCKGSTRGRRPRAFNIPEPALSWMKAFDFKTAVMKPNLAFREHLEWYAKKAGVKLPQNAGRHTFITMHAAAYHNPILLSSIVGNTESVRANSYDGVEIEANGKAYFEITPEAFGFGEGG